MQACDQSERVVCCHMRTRLARSYQRLALFHVFGILCAFPNGCKGTTEPSLRFVAPQLDSLWMEPLYTRFTADGVLAILAGPADRSLRIADEERIQLTVSTSGGDEESFSMGRFICNHSRDCTGLIVTMAVGHSTTELGAVIDDLPARIYSASSTTAGVRVLEWEQVDAVIGMIQRAPSVRLVDRDALGCAACSSLPLSYALGSIAVAVASTPRRNDGVLQVTTGQNLTVRYSQPTGESLTRAIAVP
jgi:hypothetical protein